MGDRAIGVGIRVGGGLALDKGRERRLRVVGRSAEKGKEVIGSGAPIGLEMAVGDAEVTAICIGGVGTEVVVMGVWAGVARLAQVGSDVGVSSRPSSSPEEA